MFTRILVFAVVSFTVSPFPGLVFAEEKDKGNKTRTGTIHVVEDEVYRYDPESPPSEQKKPSTVAPRVKKEPVIKRTPESTAPATSAPAKSSEPTYTAPVSSEPATAAPTLLREQPRQLADEDKEPDDGEEWNPIGEDFNLELRGAYWLATLATSLRVDSGELQGTEVDLVNDLGLSKQAGFPIGEITLKFFERHKIKVDFVQISYSARNTVKNDFVFNGVTYPAESDVATTLNIQSIRFGYEVDLFRSSRGYFAFRLSGDYLKTNASLVTNDTLYNKADVTLVAPLVALAGRINAMPWLSITLDVAGVGYDKSYVYDGTIYFDINPVRNAGLTFGWRSITVNVEIEGKKAYVQWSGPYAGMIIRF